MSIKKLTYYLEDADVIHDDYDTLFEARHGRGALDPTPVIGREAISAPFGGIASSLW